MTFRLAGWSFFGASDHGPLRVTSAGVVVVFPDDAARLLVDQQLSRAKLSRNYSASILR